MGFIEGSRATHLARVEQVQSEATKGASVRHKRVMATSLAVVCAALGAATGQPASAAKSAGCSIPKGSERLRLDPATLTTKIDNPWWPMKPGSRWVYRETDADGAKQRVVVTVTNKTKRIENGVTARVVHDVVTEDGELVEVTDDWYAQDSCGNIWYLGEDTAEYENGKIVSRKGSFEAGVDGAQPGIIMPAKPRPGLAYRQEHYPGEAEDRGQIVSLRERAEVPFGFFETGRVLMTRDVNPLDPKILEFKFYARGIGPVLAIGVSGGSDREELVRYTRGK